MRTGIDLRSRFKAAGIHLSLSALVASLSALLVFALWYPWPYRTMSGGQELFILLVSVDLIMGPALTFAVFSRNKAKSLLVGDLLVIVILQLCALAYGMYVVFSARPVALVLEQGRFRVVSAIDVVSSELPDALPELRTLSLSGPKILSTRKPHDGDEKYKSIMKALEGKDVGLRPSFWQPYGLGVKNALNHARPLSAIYKQYPTRFGAIDSEVKKTGYRADDLKFLPVISLHGNWIALLDANAGEPIGFLPYDGFF